MSETTKRIGEIVTCHLFGMPITDELCFGDGREHQEAMNRLAEAIATHLHQEVIRGKKSEVLKIINEMKLLEEEDYPDKEIVILEEYLDNRLNDLTAELEGEK